MKTELPPNVKRVYAALKKYKQLTTWGITTRAHVCSASTVVSKLRGFGIPVKRSSIRVAGKIHHVYQLG